MFRAPAGDGEPWKRVLRRANSEVEARRILDQAEAALDTERETPVGADIRAARTIRMLGEEYLRDSIARGKQPRTMEQRVSRLNAHILPTIGDVPVTKWRVEHSRRVMDKGSKTLFSQRGREDLRGQLAAMRKLAWRLGWLDRSIYPLDGLEIGRANVLHGATAQYVDPRLRPETRQVRAMADAADKLCGPEGDDPLMTRLPLFGTKIRVAGFGGLRLGEQNALRAIDAFFEHGYVQVNGSWITPRGQAGLRGPVKNHTLHEVPLPRSLMHEELLPRVKELLDLPAKASLQQDELWLFVDNVTGLPVKPEMHNERWHRVRAWVEENDPDNAWPRTIVYRNLRHHVRAGEDALRDSVSKLAEL